MCRLPAMRAPRSGCSGANSSRIAMRPGISVSAIAISLRPQSASARSATLKSEKFLVSVAAFIGHSIVGDRAAGGGKRSRHPVRGHGSTSAVAMGDYPEPGRMRWEPRAILLQRSSGRGRGFYPRRSPAVDSSAQQRGDEARFALVEALGVEGFRQLVELVVEVMAELVDQRAQERLERDDVPARRGAHPDGDPRRRALVVRLVETVELAARRRRDVARAPGRGSSGRDTRPPARRSRSWQAASTPRDPRGRGPREGARRALRRRRRAGGSSDTIASLCR